jgi:hypothetical protein
MEGVYHPHSFLVDRGEVWTCESKTNKLRSLKGKELFISSSSYLRGLAANEECFYVGSSKRRVISESTGKPVRGVGTERRGTCALYRLDRKTGKLETLVDFSQERNEIYDILPLFQSSQS